LELVRDLLGVVEAVRGDEVDARARAVAHRAQRAGPHGLVVGEDVVDLVAAPPAVADPADGGGPRRRRLVDVALPRLRLVPLLVGIARILGKAEVDEGAVPCVTEGHRSLRFALRRGTPASGL